MAISHALPCLRSRLGLGGGVGCSDPMATPGSLRQSAVLKRLGEDRPLVAVELRPPKSGLSSAQSMDMWIDMYHAIRRLARRHTIRFRTDNPGGQSEGEHPGQPTAT